MDDGEEPNSDGSMRDYGTKSAGMPKRFGTEKQLFEKLRHRLFPQDPHAERSECLLLLAELMGATYLNPMLSKWKVETLGTDAHWQAYF
jgi:hypothetical protein